MTKILGVDPGTATMGYGLIEAHKRGANPSFSYITHGCLTTSKALAPEDRLRKIEQGLEKLIAKHRPSLLAVETLFFSKNQKTAMAVSEARGIVLLVASNHNIAVRNFTPLQTKMAVTGYGKADKKQVQKMVQHALRLPKIPTPDDAADALAIAIVCSVALENPLLVS